MEKTVKKDKEGIQLTIIEKIEALMKKHSVNQATLARDLNIGQAQLSKCLNRKGNNYIGIDMLMKISDYFRVPVDNLLGRTTLEVVSKPLSNPDICRNLINLIETDTVNIVVREIEQDTFQTDSNNPSDQTAPIVYEKKKGAYKLFFFSNYTFVPDMNDMNESEKKAAESKLRSAGLYNPKGLEINAFIEYYLKLRNLYRNNELPKAFFEQAVEDRLNQMRF
ncbi:MAG: helix-turn-helix domain-containing protein [Lachnospiraceae bacterium]|nr:helix-turn-helix domain-containing protein [Lachnospiraceae bacterium]